MQNAINALEYNLRNTESGIKDLTEQLHATEKGAHRLRGELNDAQRRRADTQQALDILRAVNGSAKSIDPRKDASLTEAHRPTLGDLDRIGQALNAIDQKSNGRKDAEWGGTACNFLRDLEGVAEAVSADCRRVVDGYPYAR